MILKMKQTQGITLMALIVTIIVLLILAGISISMISGNNGIINKAIEARDATEIAGLVEEIKMEILEKQMDNLGNLTSDDLRDVLKEHFTGVPESLPEDENELAELELTTIDGKHTIKVGDIWQGSLSDSSGGVATLPSNTGTTPYLPSADFSQVAGTDLSSGLVIEDNLGNQYVWIEVPNDGTGPNYTGITSKTQYDEIEVALQAYAADYRKGSAAQSYSWEDEYYSDDVTGLTQTQYNNLKETMLASVYTNGGFWIGRYEAGDSEATESNTTITSSNTSHTVVSKADQIPYTYVTCSEAQTLANSVNSGNYTSSLMFGIQWDLVMKYLEEKGTTYEELAGTNPITSGIGSVNWGNYYNTPTFTITNTQARYNTDPASASWTLITLTYEKKQNSRVLLTTGADSRLSKQNIYDIAGNVYEWTLEHATSSSSKPCVNRGGLFETTGYAFPASYRSNYEATLAQYYVRLSCFTLLKKILKDEKIKRIQSVRTALLLVRLMVVLSTQQKKQQHIEMLVLF